MNYSESQKKSGLEKGDLVEVIRSSYLGELGWNIDWSSNMNKTVNQKLKIIDINDSGIGLENGYVYPYFVLKLIEKSLSLSDKLKYKIYSEAYKLWAKEVKECVNAAHIGMCCYIKKVYYNHINNSPFSFEFFPEFYAYKPLHCTDNEYWFNDDFERDMIFKKLIDKYNTQKSISVKITYNDDKAHKLYVTNIREGILMKCDKAGWKIEDLIVEELK